MDLLPLERVFEKEAKNRSKFPHMGVNYFGLYEGLVNHLRTNIYNNIDAGLAANSEVPGLYTAHNSEHFDEVVRYAGSLLGIETGDETTQLGPYELYILLVAIRIHDIGNIYGREEHERHCFTMLRDFGSICGEDDAEKKVIANIAQAHGGKSTHDDKDTISELDSQKTISKIRFRPQLIASIVRFADEICENRYRAPLALLKADKIPTHNQIFHKYASSIVSNEIQDSRLEIRYEVQIDDLAKPWGRAITGNDTEVYLIDEILERIEKMDQERRYCNVFSRELYTINSIRASIEVIDQNFDVLRQIPIPECHDRGYPQKRTASLREQLKEICGDKLYQDLKSKEAAQ